MATHSTVKQRKAYRQRPYVKRQRAKAHAEYYKRPHVKEKHNQYMRERSQRIRLEAIAEYGGRCECCGETETDFLTFDHINNDGAEHRRELSNGKRGGGGAVLAKWLRNRSYPKNIIRILCYNCNCSLGARGYCPHQRKRNQLQIKG